MAARWVETLRELQKTDLRIRDCEQRLALIPKEMFNIKARRDQVVAATNQAAEETRKFDRAAKAAESEIAKLNEESRKLQQQSSLVKKNNEYQAMLSTIALNKKKISDLETKVLEYMDAFEEGKKNYRRIKTENEAAVKDMRSEFNELAEHSEVLKQEIARLQAGRPALAAPIERELERRYEQLLKAKNNVPPLMPVEEGICTSCHIRVTSQTMNELTKGAVVYCDNCQHLIYLEDVK